MLQSVVFLISAALAPPVALLLLVYHMDRLEKEPPRLLFALFLRGAAAMVPILVLEVLADQFIDFFPWSYYAYLFLAYFVVPGFIEEGVKYRVLLRRVWKEPNFNCYFDAVVYAVFVSLGFAAVENVMYVLTSGFETAVARAVFAIPGHMMFGVVMGWGSPRPSGRSAPPSPRPPNSCAGGLSWPRRCSTASMTFFWWGSALSFIYTLFFCWSGSCVCCAGAQKRTGPSSKEIL